MSEEISKALGKENVVRFGVLLVSSKANNLVPSLLKATFSISESPIQLPDATEKEIFLSYTTPSTSLGVTALNFPNWPNPSVSTLSQLLANGVASPEKFEFINYNNEISNNNLNQSSTQYGKTQLKRVLYSINTINNKRPIIHKLNIL